jgi:hypothetical protein
MKKILFIIGVFFASYLGHAQQPMATSLITPKTHLDGNLKFSNN